MHNMAIKWEANFEAQSGGSPLLANETSLRRYFVTEAVPRCTCESGARPF